MSNTPNNLWSGSTLIHVRRDKVWSLESLSSLSIGKSQPFQTLAWNGHSLALSGDAVCSPGPTVNKIVRIRLSNGHKMEIALGSKVCLYSSRTYDRVEVDDNNLRYISADELKTGDKILSVDLTGMKCEPHNALGTQHLSFVYVTKVKVVSCDLTPMYYLTSDDSSNVVLAAGVFVKTSTNSLVPT